MGHWGSTDCAKTYHLDCVTKGLTFFTVFIYFRAGFIAVYVRLFQFVSLHLSSFFLYYTVVKVGAWHSTFNLSSMEETH